MGKSKRNTPKPDSNRAQRLAERRAAQERAGAAATRPFQGLAAECDLVAFREFVPSATAELTIPDAKRPVRLATVLPGAVAALVRAAESGDTGFVAAQVQHGSGDPAADLGVAVRWAQTAEPGESLASAAAAAQDDSPRLADLIDPDAALDITVHQDFGWWIPADVTPDPQVAVAVERANGAILPTAQVEVDAPGAAWWVDAGEKAHLRWVRPEDEDDLMRALARIHAAGALTLGEGSRFAGTLRTHGLLIPVFDLDRERAPEHWAPACAAFDTSLRAALAEGAPLTSGDRRARDYLSARQLTLR
ncbi:MAG: hypothetical protein HOQ24_02090 [Mycobacteriaceae bacterium]|nr:hypothetical protein [Mycobacteriaceae bacterium]